MNEVKILIILIILVISILLVGLSFGFMNNKKTKNKLKIYWSSDSQTKIFDNGNLIYKSPSLKEIAEYSKNDLDSFWDEIKRIDNPHKYFVDLSQNLWDLKQELLNK